MKRAFTLAKGTEHAEIWAVNPQYAFTLAEVLITLGIIGIIAAMTLPALINKYQKNVTIAELQKVYTVLNQALNLSQADNGEFKYWDNALAMGQEEYYQKYFAPYFKIAKVCQTYQECGYKSITPWTYIQNGTDKTETINVVNVRLRRTIILTDGTLAAFSVSTGEGTVLDNNIYVDLNGPKNPNRAGRDYFVFTRTEKNGIQPYGYNLTNEQINNQCRKTYTGYTCAAKIIGDSWQIRDDYPW